MSNSSFQFQLSAITASAVPKKHAIPIAMIQSGLRRSLTTGLLAESGELDGGWSTGSEFIVALFRMRPGKHNRSRWRVEHGEQRLRRDFAVPREHFSRNMWVPPLDY
jgi:hypothetical protein